MFVDDSPLSSFVEACLNAMNARRRAELSLPSGWEDWEAVLDDLRVQSLAPAAIAELSSIAELVTDLAVVPGQEHWDEDDYDSVDLPQVLTFGMLRRMASDGSAISALIKSGAEGTAAGLCRSVYEGCGWVDLFLHPDAGADACRLYVYYHQHAELVRIKARLDEFRKLRESESAACSDSKVAQFLPFKSAKLADEKYGLVKKQLREFRSEARKGDSSLNDVTGDRRPYQPVRDNRGLPVPQMQKFWSVNLYDPSCHLLHVGDALEFMTVASDTLEGGAPAEFNSLRPRPRRVLTAAVVRSLQTWPAAVLALVEGVDLNPEDASELEAVANRMRLVESVVNVLESTAQPWARKEQKE